MSCVPGNAVVKTKEKTSKREMRVATAIKEKLEVCKFPLSRVLLVTPSQRGVVGGGVRRRRRRRRPRHVDSPLYNGSPIPGSLIDMS